MNKDIRGLQEYDVKPMICNMKFIGIITGFCSGCGLISLIQATFLTGMFEARWIYGESCIFSTSLNLREFVCKDCGSLHRLAGVECSWSLIFFAQLQLCVSFVWFPKRFRCRKRVPNDVAEPDWQVGKSWPNFKNGAYRIPMEIQ